MRSRSLLKTVHPCRDSQVFSLPATAEQAQPATRRSTCRSAEKTTHLARGRGGGTSARARCSLMVLAGRRPGLAHHLNGNRGAAMGSERSKFDGSCADEFGSPALRPVRQPARFRSRKLASELRKTNRVVGVTAMSKRTTRSPFTHLYPYTPLHTADEQALMQYYHQLSQTIQSFIRRATQALVLCSAMEHGSRERSYEFSNQTSDQHRPQ